METEKSQKQEARELLGSKIAEFLDDADILFEKIFRDEIYGLADVKNEMTAAAWEKLERVLTDD